MRSNILSLAAFITAMGVAGAFAATDTSGVIKSIDASALTVTLADGSTYHLPAGFDLKGFKVGEKVTVNWETKGALKEALGMKAS